MYRLKIFHCKELKTSSLPIIECFIGEVKIGMILSNLSKRSSNCKFVFRSAIALDGDGTHLYADGIEELKELALNKFRELICNLLQ